MQEQNISTFKTGTNIVRIKYEMKCKINSRTKWLTGDITHRDEKPYIRTQLSLRTDYSGSKKIALLID